MGEHEAGGFGCTLDAVDVRVEILARVVRTGSGSKAIIAWMEPPLRGSGRRFS